MMAPIRFLGSEHYIAFVIQKRQICRRNLPFQCNHNPWLKWHFLRCNSTWTWGSGRRGTVANLSVSHLNKPHTINHSPMETLSLKNKGILLRSVFSTLYQNERDILLAEELNQISFQHYDLKKKTHQKIKTKTTFHGQRGKITSKTDVLRTEKWQQDRVLQLHGLDHQALGSATTI